jgi:hypothetical protein
MRTFQEPVTSSHLMAGNCEMLWENLIENLYLRWSWTVGYVEEYTNEEEQRIFLLMGAHRESNSSGQQRDHTYVVKIGEVDGVLSQITVFTNQSDFRGLPFKTEIQHPTLEDHGRIVEKMLEYCRVPYGEGSDATDVVRGLARRWINSRRKRKVLPANR